MLSDQQIIEQAINGEQSAYQALVQRYQDLVFTLVLKIVKKREEAEEVAQDCFLRAFRYLPTYRGDAAFSTWIYRIAYTTALNHVRKKQLRTVSMDDDETSPIQVPSEALNAQEALEQNENYSILHRAIEELSATDAAIITLFYLQEQSLDEICKTMDLTMSNAKTKLCRARQRLKPILEHLNQCAN